MKTFREFIEIVEGKVEWDNPKRPLQSGLTPREKNRAVRKRLGIENPDVVDNPSFFKGGPSERDYERYGKLQAAHESEKDKKVPKDKRHEFAVYAKGRLGGKYSLGKIRRMAGIHKGAKTGRSAEKGTGTYAVMSQVQGGEKVMEKHKKRYGDYADLRRLREPKESFDYELEESSTGESLGRRQRERITGGRAFRKMNRDERTTASIAKRAGIRGTGRLSTKDLRDRTPIYTTYKPTSEWGTRGSTKVSTYITSFPSARAAMKGADVGIIKKKEPKDPERPWGPERHLSSKDSIRNARDFRKAIVRSGGNKRGKVHDISVVQDDIDREKNEPKNRQKIGRNFIQALRDTPKHLKKAGAKKGDIVTGKPSGVVGDENKEKGAKIRAKLYKKIFGNRTTERSPKTGLMLGKV